jgi:2-(3-amino-3-carboxypropyl)histidine synthase
MFDIDSLVLTINERGAKVVGLQFPEGLKRKGPEIAKEVEKKANVTAIISGDPCYGACDIDEDLLDMVDLMFHFGHSCLVDTEKVVFIEYHHEAEVEKCVLNALPLLVQKVGIVTTVQHIHNIDRIAQVLKDAGKEPVIQKGDSRITYPGQVLGCNFTSAPKDVDSILFVGTGNFHPMGIRLATNIPVISADPFTNEARAVDVERILRQRYAVISKAMDAKKWGIIIGMKSGQKRLDMALKLKELAGDAVLISIHEISSDRLLSFKVDAYVSTVCPRVAIDDAGRFPVPVLTPVEFETLKGMRKWEDMVFDEIKD